MNVVTYLDAAGVFCFQDLPYEEVVKKVLAVVMECSFVSGLLVCVLKFSL